MPEDEHQFILNDAADMLSVLQKFERNRQQLRLTTKDQQEFNTIILECDWPARELVLDQAVSDTTAIRWEDYSTISLDGTLAGIHYQLQKLRIQPSQQQSGPSNLHRRVYFPRSIVYKQRRQAFRSTVPRAVPSQLEIDFSDGKQKYCGRILDLSASGLACECEQSANNIPAKTAQLIGRDVSLSIHLSELLTIICQAQVKEVKKATQQTSSLRFGLAFSNLCPSVQRKIDKAVADLQRLTRKNQTR